MWVQKTVMDTAVHVGAPWSVPDEAPQVARGHQFNPWAVSEEEEVTSLDGELQKCGKLQQELWRWCLAAAPAAWGPGDLSVYLHGCGAHPLAQTSLALCSDPIAAARRYKSLPLPCTLWWGSFFYCSTAPKTVVFEADCVSAVSVGQDCSSGPVQRMERKECNVLIF